LAEASFRRYARDEEAPVPALMIHHVDLAVSDVDRTIDFYKAVLGPLGLGSHVRPVTDGEGDVNVYPTYRGTEDVTYLRWGDQFVAFRQADGGEHRYYDVGIEHIAFYVDRREDVDEAYQRCLDIGARIHFPPEEDRDMPGYYEMFVFDPDGMRVEVAYSPAVTIG
jgi:catechol 2,3-dioxygenase-like lactoylglutathione lyase family enzyme